MHPYPMSMASGHDQDILVLTEEDENGIPNRFFRSAERRSSGTTMQSYLNTECLETGVTYHASATIRLHAEFEEEYYLYFRYKTPDGHWHSQTFLDCPGQSFVDGWVTCSGDFTVGEHLGSAVEVIWRFHFHNARDITVTVDYDNMSIAYKQGIVDQLVVEKDDTQCWGVGSDIHIPTSVYRSSHWWVPNSHTTEIGDITDNEDGTASITLVDAPYIPIVSLADDNDFATDVALVTRNLKITNADDEVGKGAYFQILKTPNVTQKLIGVEFANMGRKGEQDRFPLQLLYSESIEGTKISANTISGSHSRCIVVDGTSNVTVSNNVATTNKGHCIYVGFESMNNLIEGNLVSDTLEVHHHDRIPHEDVSFLLRIQRCFDALVYCWLLTLF